MAIGRLQATQALYNLRDIAFHLMHMLTGINHLTIAVTDLQSSIAFYKDVLGMRLKASWDGGAYLSVGDFWVCLSLDRKRMVRRGGF
jgi:catechol-2,3-dioxygenase